MNKTFTAILAVCLTTATWQAHGACAKETPYPQATFPELTISTSMGDVVVELDRGRAPMTVNQFLHHVQDGRYDDNLVHRVVKDYVVQTGASKTDHSQVTVCSALLNASGNGSPTDRGHLAMD